jgi:hypothetical protein
MATVTATEAQAGIQPKGLRVGLVAVTSFYSISGSISIGTTIQMIKVPLGATLVQGMVGNNNAGQATIQVGDGISTARYYTETTLSSAMGMVALYSNVTPAAMYTYSTDDTIDVVISRVSVSTLGGAVYLTCIFSMDVN